MRKCYAYRKSIRREFEYDRRRNCWADCGHRICSPRCFYHKSIVTIIKNIRKSGSNSGRRNTTIEVVTKDVDLLSRQVEGLLVKSNELLLDINGKVETIDPLFTAIADLSESVSELNTSSKNIVTKVGGIGRTTAKATVAGKVGGTALKFFKNKKHTEKTGGI